MVYTSSRINSNFHLTIGVEVRGLGRVFFIS